MNFSTEPLSVSCVSILWKSFSSQVASASNTDPCQSYIRINCVERAFGSHPWQAVRDAGYFFPMSGNLLHNKHTSVLHGLSNFAVDKGCVLDLNLHLILLHGCFHWHFAHQVSDFRPWMRKCKGDAVIPVYAFHIHDGLIVTCHWQHGLNDVWQSYVFRI